MTPSASRPADLDLTPRQIVAELDKYVVGQGAAKRAVAIALRNRWRRRQLPAAVAEEILPKNILLIGPTGVGKTEIARRLAKLAKAPFLKVEASKFTEVGYVGRDVESMVRDLVEAAVAMVKEEIRGEVREAAAARAEERLLALLVPPAALSPSEAEERGGDALETTREKFRAKLRTGALDEREVEIEVDESAHSSLEVFTPQGVEAMGLDLSEMLPGLFGGRRRRQRMTVAEARTVLVEQEAEKLIDRAVVSREARRRVEQDGIIFLDEIDKVAGRESGRGPDVSREGVQRDLLPIVEGSTVATKYGPVKTDHVLFFAAGAFHVAKPSDLIPELQGRFPIRVELEPLTEDDLVRILTEPENALTKQYAALLGAEGVVVEFRPEAIRELARLAAEVNTRSENIGARRLATLLERLLEEISFEAPDMRGVRVVLDADTVRRALIDIVRDEDLSRYVL
jgi:ATP-dependent HslUV protease ATP-binding subunit HslU